MKKAADDHAAAVQRLAKETAATQACAARLAQGRRR